MRKRALMNTFVGVDTDYDKYMRRLEKHVRELSNPITKKFTFGLGTIETIEANLMDNPNGKNKWNGWIAVGKRYTINVYKDGVIVNNGFFDDKNTANKWFLQMKELCKTFDEQAWFK